MYTLCIIANMFLKKLGWLRKSEKKSSLVSTFLIFAIIDYYLIFYFLQFFSQQNRSFLLDSGIYALNINGDGAIASHKGFVYGIATREIFTFFFAFLSVQMSKQTTWHSRLPVSISRWYTDNHLTVPWYA